MGEVAVTLKSGDEVLVAIADRDTGGLVANMGTGEARQPFGEAVSRPGPAADALLKRVRDLTEQADEITVEFGVTLEVEADVLIAKSFGVGSSKVAVKCQRSDAESG